MYEILSVRVHLMKSIVSYDTSVIKLASLISSVAYINETTGWAKKTDQFQKFKTWKKNRRWFLYSQELKSTVCITVTIFLKQDYCQTFVVCQMTTSFASRTVHQRTDHVTRPLTCAPMCQRSSNQKTGHHLVRTLIR